MARLCARKAIIALYAVICLHGYVLAFQCRNTIVIAHAYVLQQYVLALPPPLNPDVFPRGLSLTWGLCCCCLRCCRFTRRWAGWVTTGGRARSLRVAGPAAGGRAGSPRGGPGHHGQSGWVTQNPSTDLQEKVPKQTPNDI